MATEADRTTRQYKEKVPDIFQGTEFYERNRTLENVSDFGEYQWGKVKRSKGVIMTADENFLGRDTE